MGDYSIFIKDWKQPSNGIHGYLNRFLVSGDPTFQHIAIWTLLQLLESEDKKLIDLIKKAEDITGMVKGIAERNVDQNEDDEDNSEGEVVALAEKVMQLLDDPDSSRSGGKEPKSESRSGEKELESERTASS